MLEQLFVLYSSGLIRSFIEVYKENGIAGYYAGLVPRLIANAAVLVLVSSSTYVINKYVIRDQELKTYTASTMKVNTNTNIIIIIQV